MYSGVLEGTRGYSRERGSDLDEPVVRERRQEPARHGTDTALARHGTGTGRRGTGPAWHGMALALARAAVALARHDMALAGHGVALDALMWRECIVSYRVQRL